MLSKNYPMRRTHCKNCILVVAANTKIAIDRVVRVAYVQILHRVWRSGTPGTEVSLDDRATNLKSGPENRDAEVSDAIKLKRDQHDFA